MSPLHDPGSGGQLLIGRNTPPGASIGYRVSPAATCRRALPSDLPNLPAFKTIIAPATLFTPAMKLTEAQVISVIRATKPLQAGEQAAFLGALVMQLAGHNEVGDGELWRTLARLQREHFRPPTDADVSGWDAQYRHMDGAPAARIGTDFWREMRQRHAVMT